MNAYQHIGIKEIVALNFGQCGRICSLCNVQACGNQSTLISGDGDQCTSTIRVSLH